MSKYVEKVSAAKIAGRNLKNFLKEGRITQEAFADILSVDPRTVRRWISDGIHDLDRLEYIATKLNRNPSDFIRP